MKISIPSFSPSGSTVFSVLMVGWMTIGVLFVTTATMAQATKEEVPGLTLENFNKIKAFKIKNLETDTYVKMEGQFVLDRYEMKPPYVFKYSDGIERRIYLYKLLDNKTKKDLGLVSFYHTPANNQTITLCIPGPTADKSIWAAYIDDLKHYGKQEKGFLSTTSYVLSREMSALVTNGGQPTPSTGAKTDYDVCFPAGTPVTLADGSEKPIEEIKAGDFIASFDPITRQSLATEVLELQSHTGKGYALSQLRLFPSDELIASAEHSLPTLVSLEATPNHPVMTAQGRKAVDQLQPDDVLYLADKSKGKTREFKVHQVIPGYRTVNQVYNLVTRQRNYLVKGLVVLDK